MKKILALILTLVFAFALSACNNKDAVVNNNNSEKIVDSSPVENAEPENTKLETPQPEKSQPETSHQTETQKDADAKVTTTIQDEVKVDVTETEQNKSGKNPETKDNTAQDTTSNDENITREKAVKIALRHAGLEEKDVYDLDVEFDREKNATVWEVDFETKEYEYSFEIDVKTGNIIKDKKEPQDKEEATPSTTPAITRDRAIELALSHAGLKRTEAFDIDAELDKERNGIFWEVDFETKEHEYSYTINAVNEEIITSEKERN